MQPLHRFDPSATGVPPEPAVLALLAATPAGQPVRLVFGADDCPPGAVMAPALGCCWQFERGGADVIHQLSLGTSNVWVLDWVCHPTHLRNTRTASPPPEAHPWVAHDPDFALFVFPTAVEATFVRADATLVVPAGTQVGRLDYVPNGHATFVPDNLTYAVRGVFAMFDVLFGCIDDAPTQGVQPPAFFITDPTEPRMVRFMRRFGMWPVAGAGLIGSVEEVRARHEAMRDVAPRLADRAAREASRSPPRPGAPTLPTRRNE